MCRAVDDAIAWAKTEGARGVPLVIHLDGSIFETDTTVIIDGTMLCRLSFAAELDELNRTSASVCPHELLGGVPVPQRGADRQRGECSTQDQRTSRSTPTLSTDRAAAHHRRWSTCRRASGAGPTRPRHP